jgi:hypothetical protein
MGKSHAEIVVNWIIEKTGEAILRDTLIAAAVDIFGGCGMASTAYAGIQSMQQAKALHAMCQKIISMYGRKHNRLSNKMLEDAWESCGFDN